MKFFSVFLMLLIGNNIFSQINSLTPINIGVNWNKTTHILFPTSIKYFSTVSNYIAADKIDNILSIKANEEDFLGASSLSVATGDGKFYTFSIRYKDTLNNTLYMVEKDSTNQPKKLFLNQQNDIHLIFPLEVNYIDYGSDIIEAKPASDLQNIVRISAKEKFDFVTNISLSTTDKKFYTFDIAYNEKETNFSHIIGEPNHKSIALLNKEDLTDNGKFAIISKIEEKGRKINTLGITKNKVKFAIQNIFVMDNKLIFRVEIVNLSNIKYDIDYIKFYIVDRKRNKKTASQELESMPLFIDKFEPVVEAKDRAVLSVCFEKFTIPDNKFFVIEINEKNGGRHIQYKLKNSDIINAEAL